jgi:hypothetical protein
MKYKPLSCVSRKAADGIKLMSTVLSSKLWGGCQVCRRILSLSPNVAADIKNKLGSVHIT